MYNELPADLLKKINFDAGVVLTKFDVTKGTVDKKDIIGATTGGTSFNSTPTMSNLFDDIDNVPGSIKQGARIDKYEPHLTGTLITIDEDSIQKMLVKSAVDKNTTEGVTKFTAKQGLVPTDAFFDVWVVTGYAAVADGNGDIKNGYFAIHLKNCIDVSGFQKQTANNGKSTYAIDFKAHYDADNPEDVPFEIYISDGVSA